MLRATGLISKRSPSARRTRSTAAMSSGRAAGLLVKPASGWLTMTASLPKLSSPWVMLAATAPMKL